MDKNRVGQLAFLGAVAVAATLYALTVPQGLPWNPSSHLAIAYLGEVVRFPVMPHPIWGFHVQVFGSAVALSVFMAAVAAGFLAALVNRLFGWRFAASVALVWIFLPGVWNRAVTGQRGICLAAVVVVVTWMLYGVARFVLRKVREALRAVKRAGGVQVLEDLLASVHEQVVRRERMNRIVGWAAMGVAGVFALVSLAFHDYRLGEPASVFAKGVVGAAAGRTIVLNGVCDAQIVRELKANAEGRSRPGPHLGLPMVFLRNDEAYRTSLVARVKSEFPFETNLWVAARISAGAFAEAAVRRYPDRFYLMDGRSTTPEQWESRWEAFKPYLGSSDPFVRVARRLFGYEGNAVANANDAVAWRLYRRIYEEVDPGNFSALVNLNEMARRGCAASGDEKRRMQEKLAAFFNDAGNRSRARAIARASGPIRADPALLAEMVADAKRRIFAKIAAGEKVEMNPELLSLVEWNNAMVERMNRGELVKAGRIARTILANPKWKGFVPANAVMGSVASSEGDYVASERFFQVATGTTNAVPAVVLNDYADTLSRLGKTDEAENVARRAVRASEGGEWLPRLTLAEILEKKATRQDRVWLIEDGEPVERFVKTGEADEAEVRELLKTVLRYAPASVQEKIRKEHKGFVR